MATVGDQLLQPEAGWRRYDDRDSSIYYDLENSGVNIGPVTEASSYNQTVYQIYKGKAIFKFTGTKIRLISFKSATTAYNSSTYVKIDGVNVGLYSNYGGSTQYQIILFEKLDLSDGTHIIEIINPNANGTVFAMDAIDIGETNTISSAINTTLESGLKRFQDSYTAIKYIGIDWVNIVGNHYTDTKAKALPTGLSVEQIKTNYIEFKFIGTKLKIFGDKKIEYSNDISITIDGNTTQGNATASGTYIEPIINITGLTNSIHIVKIVSNDGLPFSIDCIDTDGRIVHNILPEKTSLADMEIGDVISCEYTAASGAVGTFANLGNATKDVIPPASVAAPNGSFYFVKVDENLLVADRVVQHSISWDALNAGGYIEGSLLIKNHNVQNYIATGNYDTTRNLAQLNDPSGSVLFPLYYKTRPIGDEYLQYNYLEPVIVNNMKLRTRGTASGFEPLSKFKIFGSNNNFSTEVELFNGIYSTPDYFQDFNFINNTAFSSYRIYLTEWVAGNLGDGANIDRLFLGESIGLIRSLSGGSAYMDYLKKKEVVLHLPLVSDIVDKSPIPRSVTITGTTTMPEVQEGAGKFDNSSLYFNGTNSTLTLPNNICNFGTRDFTIDCWVKIPTVASGGHPVIIGNTNSTLWNSIYISDHTQEKKISIVNNSNNPRVLVSTKRVDDNVYHHIVIQRRNGILQIFIDGILDASVPYSTAMNWNISPNVYVGSDGAITSTFLQGYINDLRIIKGTGIYEGNFTPPTELLPKQVSELDIPVMSTTNQAFGGFPNTNEWDKYIVNSDLEGKVTPGDNSVWNYNIGTWAKEAPASGVLDIAGGATNTSFRNARGFIDAYGGRERITYGASTYLHTSVGFRPVLQLKHDNQSNIWR